LPLLDALPILVAVWRDLPQPAPGDGEASFVRRPVPTWTYATEFGVVERTIAMRRQAAPIGSDEFGSEESVGSAGSAAGATKPSLLIRYRNRSEHAIRLEVRPLLGWCHVDHLPPANEGFDHTVHARGASWGFRPTDELPALWLTVDGIAAFRSEPV